MQNKALRFITGQYVNTNCNILRAEADIPSYSSHSDQLIAKPRKKAMQSAPDHPRRLALEGPTTRGLIRPAHSWRSKSALLCSKLPATSNYRKPINCYQSPSWIRYDSVTVFEDVPSMTGKSDTAENQQCRHPTHPRAAVIIHNILFGRWLNGRRSSSSSDNRRPFNTHNHQNNCATRSSTHQLL